MPKYMIMARYSPEVMLSLIQAPESIHARDAHAFKFYESVGGKVIDYWFIRSSEYNFAIVVDFPSSTEVNAVTLVGWASTAFDQGAVYELADPDDFVETMTTAARALQVFASPKEEATASPRPQG